jgi:hypothetical protein
MIYPDIYDPGHSPSIRFSGQSGVMRHEIRRISDSYRIASKRPAQPTPSCRRDLSSGQCALQQHPRSLQNLNSGFGGVERNTSRSASFTVTGIASGRWSGYPRLARRGNELIFARTDAGERSQVRTAVARLASPSTNP